MDAGAPVRLLVALNDEIADGRDVSWIWDVDFEPLVGALEELVVERLAGPGAGAALQVRRARPGEDRGSCRTSRRRSTDGVEATPPGGELVVLPTYTAMLALRQIAAEQGLVRPYWEEAVA